METERSFLKTGMSRRRALGLVAGASVAIGTGAFSALPAAAGWGVAYRTTSNVNMRKTASPRGDIIMVVPAGAKVIDYDGVVENNYRGVDYNGTVGWISNDYLEEWNAAPPPATWVGQAKTTANVNLRSEPGLKGGIIKVVPAGTWVDISDKVSSHYRYVSVNGTVGWIADAYLGGGNEGAFIATANVNMRLTASLSGRILTVVPKGATVIDYNGELENGFRGVDYNGRVGWVYDAFLKKA
jgi:uncharacterized protein YgiM (DUF1202 family)